MALAQALLSKIANAKTSTSGNQIKAGDYVLLVKRNICEQKFSGTMFIPEFDVIESESVVDDVTPNRVGTDCSCAWALDKGGKAGEAALGNIKQYMCGLFGLPDTTPTEDVMKVVGENSGAQTDTDALRARGMLIRCTTRRKKIQNGPNAGKEGDFPHFATVSAVSTGDLNIDLAETNTPAAVAARRAQLDAAKR